MTLNDVSTVRFHGKDAAECNEFVAAVINHAFDQGKSRDDEWIADFVATRMTGEALRWWSGLDENIQGSWKELRRAMFDAFPPVFEGKSGEEAEEFVRLVRQRARQAGKQRDNDWIIDFVMSCLAGDALRWHLSLDPSAQSDWNLLQVAILVQYPREGGFQDLSLVSLPTPAPAAAVPSKLKRAHIRVCKENDSSLLFLTKQSDSSNGLRVSPTATEALIVEYDTSIQGPQALSIPDGQISNYDRLVIHWQSADTTAALSYAYFFAMRSGSDSTPLNSNAQGHILQHPWVVSSSPSRHAQMFSLTAVDTKGTALLRSSTSMTWLWLRRGFSASDIALELFIEPI